MGQIQFMDFKKRFQFPHDQKKEPKEFQPWVKLHVFLVSLPLVFYLFLREVLTPPLGGYGRPSLKKTLKTDGLEDDPFLLGRYILGGRTVGF